MYDDFFAHENTNGTKKIVSPEDGYFWFSCNYLGIFFAGTRLSPAFDDYHWDSPVSGSYISWTILWRLAINSSMLGELLIAREMANFMAS